MMVMLNAHPNLAASILREVDPVVYLAPLWGRLDAWVVTPLRIFFGAWPVCEIRVAKLVGIQSLGDAAKARPSGGVIVWNPYPAEAGCPTVAGRRRTRAAPAGI